MDRLPTHVEHYSTSAYAPYLCEHRLAGSVGDMLEVAQPAGDFSDPPTSDLVLIRAVSDGMSQISDLGGGRFEKRSRAGDLFLVGPEIATDILVHDPHVIRIFAFPAAMVRPRLEEVRPGTNAFDFGHLHAGAFRNPLLLGLLDQLWADAEHGEPASRLFADGAVLAITAELLRESSRPIRPERGGLAGWQLKRIESLIRARLDEDLPLAALADAAGLSPYHFARAFKASTGLPPHRYQMMLRVEHAKAMLATTGLSVTETAHACGFASSQHMATVFRRMVGITPTAYRRKRLS